MEVFQNIYFSRNDLSYMDFSGQDLRGKDFSGKNLSFSDFTNAIVTGATFSGCILNQTRLGPLTGRPNISADLYLIQPTESTFWIIGQNLNLIEIDMSGMSNKNLSNINLSDSNLSRAILTNVILTSVQLINANLTGAILTNTDLTLADLTNANLTGVDLRTATLTSVTLNNTNIYKAIVPSSMNKTNTISKSGFTLETKYSLNRKESKEITASSFKMDLLLGESYNFNLLYKNNSVYTETKVLELPIRPSMTDILLLEPNLSIQNNDVISKIKVIIKYREDVNFIKLLLVDINNNKTIVDPIHEVLKNKDNNIEITQKIDSKQSKHEYRLLYRTIQGYYDNTKYLVLNYFNPIQTEVFKDSAFIYSFEYGKLKLKLSFLETLYFQINIKKTNETIYSYTIYKKDTYNDQYYIPIEVALEDLNKISLEVIQYNVSLNAVTVRTKTFNNIITDYYTLSSSVLSEQYISTETYKDFRNIIFKDYLSNRIYIRNTILLPKEYYYIPWSASGFIIGPNIKINSDLRFLPFNKLNLKGVNFLNFDTYNTKFNLCIVDDTTTIKCPKGLYDPIDTRPIQYFNTKNDDNIEYSIILEMGVVLDPPIIKKIIFNKYIENVYFGNIQFINCYFDAKTKNIRCCTLADYLNYTYILTNGYFIGKGVKYTDLSNTIFRYFGSSDINRDVSNCNLTRCDFRDFDISGMNFTNSTLRYYIPGPLLIKPVNVILPTGYKVVESTINGVKSYYLLGPYADLTNITINECDLTDVDLSNTIISNTQITASFLPTLSNYLPSPSYTFVRSYCYLPATKKNNNSQLYIPIKFYNMIGPFVNIDGMYLDGFFYYKKGYTDIFFPSSKSIDNKPLSLDDINFFKVSGRSKGGIFMNNPNSVLVAVGSGTNTIAYSYDGINWNGVVNSSSIFTEAFGAIWNGKMCVTVGSGTNTIAYSYDGINWNGVMNSPSIFSSGAGVSCNGTMWVAVGSGTNTIAYSYDGINWNGVGKSIFSNGGIGVDWNGTMWVAVGSGTNSIAYSYDGINWNGVVNSQSIVGLGARVSWDGIMWIAVGWGTNTIAYSYDGINWKGVVNSSSIFSSGGFGIACNISVTDSNNKVLSTVFDIETFSISGDDHVRWVAVGQGTNTIAYSYDGINWTGIGKSIFSNGGMGVSWNAIMWVAVGWGTNTIAYSYDGINWYALGTSIFSDSGYAVASSKGDAIINDYQLNTKYKLVKGIICGPNIDLASNKFVSTDIQLDNTIDYSGISYKGLTINTNSKTFFKGSIDYTGNSGPTIGYTGTLLNLSANDFSDGNFSDVTLFSSCNLSDAIFNNCKFYKTVFYNSNFNNCSFKNISIKDSKFINCTFEKATGSSGVLFQNISWENSECHYCSFDNAIFTDSKCFDLVLENNKLTNIKFSNTIFNSKTYKSNVISSEYTSTTKGLKGNGVIDYLPTITYPSLFFQNNIEEYLHRLLYSDISSYTSYTNDYIFFKNNIVNEYILNKNFYVNSIQDTIYQGTNMNYKDNLYNELNFIGNSSSTKDIKTIRNDTFSLFQLNFLIFLIILTNQSLSDTVLIGPSGPSKKTDMTTILDNIKTLISGFDFNFNLDNNKYINEYTDIVTVTGPNDFNLTDEEYNAYKQNSSNSYDSTYISSDISKIEDYNKIIKFNVKDLQLARTSSISKIVNCVTEINKVNNNVEDISQSFITLIKELNKLNSALVKKYHIVFKLFAIQNPNIDINFSKKVDMYMNEYTYTSYANTTLDTTYARLDINSVKNLNNFLSLYDSDIKNTGWKKYVCIQNFLAGSLCLSKTILHVLIEVEEFMGNYNTNASKKHIFIFNKFIYLYKPVISLLISIIKRVSFQNIQELIMKEVIDEQYSNYFNIKYSDMKINLETILTEIQIEHILIDTETVYSIELDPIYKSIIPFVEQLKTVNTIQQVTVDIGFINTYTKISTNPITPIYKVIAGIITCPNCDFSNTPNLYKYDFSGCNLTNANFSNCVLANVQNGVVTKANFKNAILTGVNFSGCNFSIPVVNDGVYIFDLDNFDLSGCNFSGCNLGGVSIKGSNMTKCIFPKDISVLYYDLSTNFTGMKTESSSYNYTYISQLCFGPVNTLLLGGYKVLFFDNKYFFIGPNTYITGIDFSGQNLSDIDITGSNIYNVTYNSSTIPPKYHKFIQSNGIGCVVGPTVQEQYIVSSLIPVNNFTSSSTFNTNYLAYKAFNNIINGTGWRSSTNVYNKLSGDTKLDNLVAVGDGTNTIAYSSDGINWSGLGTSIFSTGYGVSWNETMWVAVGTGTNSIAYSSDGISWTGLGTIIFSTGYGVSYNGIIWVAVGTGTNTLAYSSDGISWTGLGKSIFSDIGLGVAWNGTIWVAVGQGTNSIAYSTDGITWTNVVNSTSIIFGKGVAWNGKIWVVVGSGTNTIAYSYNGINWTGIGKNIFSRGFGISCNEKMWVAVGEGTLNTIAYSSDGISWTGNRKSIFSDIGAGVAWNGKMWIAVGQGTNSIAYSSDGINWTGLGTNIFSTGIGVAWNRGYNPVSLQITTVSGPNGSKPYIGQWVQVDLNYLCSISSFKIFMLIEDTNSLHEEIILAGSNDNVNWELVYDSFSFLTEIIKYQIVRKQRYNVQDLIPTNLKKYRFFRYIITKLSSNNLGYANLNQLELNAYNDIVFANNDLSNVVLSEKDLSNKSFDRCNLSYASFDNSNLTNCILTNTILCNTDLSKATLKGIKTGGILNYKGCKLPYGYVIRYGFILGPDVDLTNLSLFDNVDKLLLFDPTIEEPDNQLVLQKTMSTLNNVNLEGIDLRDYDLDYCIAGPFLGTPSYLPGTNWKIVKNIPYAIAVGYGTNSIAYSHDCINWTCVLNSTSIFSAGNAVAYNGIIWVAVGTGTNTIAYSSDGINWTGLGTSIFSSRGNGVGWNGTMWVAVGSGINTIAYSSDGINWTGLGTSIVSSRGNGVGWNGTMWVAVGSGINTIAYSSDGINWTGLGTSIFIVGNGVAWNGTMWVAVGYGITNSIAYSYNGINWTGLEKSILDRGNGVAWNGTMWVAVGSGINSIAYSSDGINWTGLGKSIFISSGFGISWNGTMWVALGDGTNTITYSSDGINWTGLGTSIFSSSGYGVVCNYKTFNQFLAGPKISFKNLVIDGCDFDYVDLKYVDFTNTTLKNVSFINSDLTGILGIIHKNSTNIILPNEYKVITDSTIKIIAGPNINLSGLDLNNFTFENMNLSGVNFNNTTLTLPIAIGFPKTQNIFINCILKNINFSGLNKSYITSNSNTLKGINFNNLDLDGCNFTNSYLRNSTFLNSNLNNVRFINSNLDDTSFKESSDNTYNILKFDNTIFYNVRTNKDTIL